MARMFTPFIAAVIAALAFPAAAQETTVLRFGLFAPATHFYHIRILLPWTKDVAEATDGRVRVEVTPAHLGPMPRNFEMAVHGIADIMAGNHGPIAGRFKVTQITEGLAPPGADPVSMSVALWRTHLEHLHRANEHEGTELLTLHTSGAFHFFTTRKPIEKPDDFANLKILAGSPIGAKIAERLGMVPIVRAVPEYYDTVSKGVVDGLMSTNTAIPGFKVEEFVKYQLKIPGGGLYGTFFVVVNQKKWDSLKGADQQAIRKVSGEAYAKRAGEVFHEEDVAAENDRRKANKSVTTIADPRMLDTVKKAFAFIDEDYVKAANAAGIDGKAALEFFRAQVSAYKR